MREHVPVLKENGYAIMVKTADFANNFTSNLTYTTKQGYEFLSNSNLFGGELIITNIGATLGKVSTVPFLPYKMTLAPNAVMIRVGKEDILEHLRLFLQSPQGYSEMVAISSGTAMKKFNKTDLKTILIPVPPLVEQKRIVSKINEITPSVLKYESSQEKLDFLNDHLNRRLKQSILREAIQGRLVPQDPTDEQASTLLGRIQKEKQKLLKEGKIKKKDIVDSAIFKGEDNKYYETIAGTNTEIELPFVFPDTWVVVRLQHICALLDGYKRAGDGICIDARFLRGKSAGEHIKSGRYVNKGDNIILVDGENSGEVFSVPIDGYMGSTFKQLWISESLYIPYVLECIRFYKDELKNSKKGAAIPHLNKDIFRSLIIGVPPINEQRRIVDRIQDIYKNLQG